jgi:hypothetical protein
MYPLLCKKMEAAGFSYELSHEEQDILVLRLVLILELVPSQPKIFPSVTLPFHLQNPLWK